MPVDENTNEVSCVFMLAPMTDRYVDLILGSLASLDTSGIFAETGRLGTCYRGAPDAVVDAVAACFAGAWHLEVHMTLEAMLTMSDTVVTAGQKAGNLAKLANTQFPMDCRFRVFGSGETKKASKALLAEAYQTLDSGEEWDYVILRGGCAEIAECCAKLVKLLKNGESLQLTFSANSPTPA